MLRRLVPQSLQGQMLLAVALALFVAQALSAALLYRSDEQRRETGIVNSLAFQLVAAPRLARQRGLDGDSRDGRRGGAENRRNRPFPRVERSDSSPQRTGEMRDSLREEALSKVLAMQGLQVEELVVVSRLIAQDPPAMRFLSRRAQIEGRELQPEDRVLLAGMRRADTEGWLIARTAVPPPNRQAAVALIVQTILLYLVLVGGLAWLLRRITRPLAALTAQVEQFGGRLDTLERIEPSGPADTRRLIEAHNAMEGRIAALLDEKDVMLGAIGHDLKTPLAALRVRIESVEDETERARMAASIEDITGTLDDILSLARVGRPCDPLERTDLAALTASVVEEYEDMGEPVTIGALDRVKLPIRATWLRRALRNLIGNALRYGETAQVSLREVAGEAVIAIADQGPGIPEQEIATMLEPFTRGEASRNRATGGAGLGLTLARAIAEQHGGSLHLSNIAGENGAPKGLLAELHLPLV